MTTHHPKLPFIFPLDEDAIPDAACAGNMPYLNHGRQIVRTTAGIWICVFIIDQGVADHRWLMLAISPRPDAYGCEFMSPIPLAGPEHPAISPRADQTVLAISNAGLVLDKDEQLHVVYERTDGLFIISSEARGDDLPVTLGRRDVWSKPQRIAPADSRLGDLVLLPSGRIEVYYTHNDALYVLPLGGVSVPICTLAQHPSVGIGADGTRHLAFERRRQIFYLRSLDGLRWSSKQNAFGAELVASFCSSWPSIAVTHSGTAVIAYQGEGKVDLRRQPEHYARLRPGGGGTVSYAVSDEGSAWQCHDLVRSSEILLKRSVHDERLPRGGERFVSHLEEFWRPSLVQDRHGAIWLFFINTTRRHLYFTRFYGERFEDVFEAGGPYDCPSRQFFVQKDAGKSSAIGFMVQAAGRLYFDALPVPVYASAEKRHVVFLDNLEVADLRGIEHVIGHWQKRPDPLPFDFSGQPKADHNVVWCMVKLIEGVWHMQYMTIKAPCRNNWLPGRAFSNDGINWKVEAPFDLDLLTLDGGPFPDSFWRPIYCKDLEENDPRRRFKGLVRHNCQESNIERRNWIAVTSSDGLAWYTVLDLEPVVMGDVAIKDHFVHDPDDPDPRRRFKVVMLLGTQAGRAATLFTSLDGIHWNRQVRLHKDPHQSGSPVSEWITGPILLDPDAGVSPWEEEIHDAVLWRENGLLMAHYDAFYFNFNQHTQKALAVSRDGRHFWRVKRGAVNMEHGACGEWDSGRDRTAIPIRHGDEFRLYYCGAPASYFADPEYVDLEADAWRHPPEADELRRWHVGMATLRVDGWAYFQMAREAGGGYLTTIPFLYEGGQLVVNGVGLGKGELRVEVLDTDGQSARSGFGTTQCRFAATEGIDVSVCWDGGLEWIHGMCRLRFVFEGLNARLYSFGFTNRKEPSLS